MIIKGYIISILYVLFCVLVSHALHKLGVEQRITRKVVHILVGFEWIILYLFMGAGSVHFLAVCLIFLVLLLIEYKLKLVPSISSENDNAPGTVYYALAMSVMAAFTMIYTDLIYPFGIAVFCTSIGDGLAGLVGAGIKKYNLKVWNSKTLLGALANLVSCFFVVRAFSKVFSLDISITWSIVIALFSAILELVSVKGLDNLLVTLGVGALTFAVMHLQIFGNYALALIVTPILTVVVISKKILTLWGTVAALILDVAVTLAFGNCGFAILFTFLSLSVVSDKVKKRAKKDGQNKNGTEIRGATQVLANGLVAMCCAIIYCITCEKIFFLAFVASMAEALADTASSGIGALSSKTYDIFKMKKCESGISGGMSWLGTAAAFFGSVIVSLIPFAFNAITIYDVALIAVIGFLGSVFDSFLGSTLQAKYRCTACDRIVERRIHCGTDTVRESGVPFMNNSAVNFLSTLFAAVITFIVFI